MTNPIHISGTPENEGVQKFDVRMYFPREASREKIIDMVMAALQDSSDLAEAELVAAYELVSDGFGGLVPAEDGLLA
jgi:hypothetical protein